MAAATLLAATPAAAQTQHDAQAWWQLNAVVPLTERLRLTVEQIARASDHQGGLYQTEVGAILGYRAVDGVELAIGYRRVGGHNGAAGANEDRLRQHVVVTAGRSVGRLRVDQRFRNDQPGIGVRIRPLLRYNLPVRGAGLALFYSHESFILPNSTRWGQRRGYERMRNIVGVALPIARGVSADVGYLNQYRLGRSAVPAQMEHALLVQLTLSMAGGSAAQVDD
ncbi:Protein of unknown function [Sphingomonas guangdongensis]|uniref:DUF2490 domain-containing protein n=1 Tax=Sphingomonas guangdongensis TaxID=1141890 RepID=A0A285R2Y5_9SPHN|nr:DUF2490 domain-containing protein [Sphingomonas guangdongensis]SOB86717.1 Protein of unknown function [Sphingomonas guangdongensis]